MSFLITLLPILLRILAMLFGGTAAISAMRVGASPDWEWMEMGKWAGGNAGAGVTSAFLAERIAAWQRSRRTADWRGAMSSIGGLNFAALLQLTFRLITLIRSDAEAMRLFGQVFGAARLPASEAEVAQLALGFRRNE